MTKSEERELVDRSKRDPSAFGRIYDENFDRIFNHILYRVANVALAEDLTAQTFLNALKSLGRFRWTGTSVSAWLYRIATNEVNSHFRRGRNVSYTDIDRVSDHLPDEKNRPDEELAIAEEMVAGKERFLLLSQCIRDLKPVEQALIVLRYFDRKPFAEIAEILGRKEGTLRMRTKRTLEKLRMRLQDRGIEDEATGRPTIQHSQAGSESGQVPAEPAPESA